MSKILKKSEKGHKEFEQGVRTLGLKYRQLLVMVNGQRSTSDLIELLDQAETLQMLQELEKMGYVEDVHTAHALTGKKSAHDDNLEDITGENIEHVKEFLTDELVKHTGAFLNRDLIERIRLVQRGADLKPCISRWHMAMREARCGNEVADQLMEDLHYLIANPLPVSVASMVL